MKWYVPLVAGPSYEHSNTSVHDYVCSEYVALVWGIWGVHCKVYIYARI